MVKRYDKDWNGPQSSEDMGRDKLRKDESPRAYPRPRDISKIVDEAHKIDSGFSGRLPKGE